MHDTNYNLFYDMKTNRTISMGRILIVLLLTIVGVTSCSDEEEDRVVEYEGPVVKAENIIGRVSYNNDYDVWEFLPYDREDFVGGNCAGCYVIIDNWNPDYEQYEENYCVVNGTFQEIGYLKVDFGTVSNAAVIKLSIETAVPYDKDINNGYKVIDGKEEEFSGEKGSLLYDSDEDKWKFSPSRHSANFWQYVICFGGDFTIKNWDLSFEQYKDGCIVSGSYRKIGYLPNPPAPHTSVSGTFYFEMTIQTISGINPEN